MIPLTVAQIAEITGAAIDPAAAGDAVVTGPVVIDSRQARPGSLFAALPGCRADGHNFAARAVAAGAAAVLASRPPGVAALIVPDVAAALAALARAVVDRTGSDRTGSDRTGSDRTGSDRTGGLTIAAVTGSAGKTTTKDLAAQLIEPLGPTVAPRDSYNNELGHPLTVLRVTERTRYLVAEMSARGAGHIAALCQISPPLLGAVLCVGHAHAGEFGSLDEVARSKAELPAALPAAGVALLNADDPRVLAMAAGIAARVVTFGRSRRADVRAAGVVLDETGRPRFTLVTAAGSAPVRLRLHGDHNVTNALAAAAMAGQLGVAVDAAAAGLSAATARSRWRMEVTSRPDGVTVINDAYNANPEAVRAALSALTMMARGRRAFAVLGPMAELGSQAEELHEQAGRQAARAGLAGLIVVGEQAAPMLAGARADRSWRGELLAVPDAAAALAAVSERVRPGDMVLVKASRAASLERVALALTGEVPL
jgi:UDP-N-acetylmuramoyl-tripeptide--D-alanyl-D-alanine ligase